MRMGESVVFQQVFNGLVTVGMAVMGIITAKRTRGSAVKMLPTDTRRRIGVIAGVMAAASIALMAVSSLTANLALAMAAAIAQGTSVGVFTFASITMMSDMTVDGETEHYLGLWSIAQAIGLGSSFVLAGALHSLTISVLRLTPGAAFAAIFAIEALLMLGCVTLLRQSSVERLRASARAPLPVLQGVTV
jgi:MFS family permease